MTSVGTWDQLFQLQFQTQAMLPLSQEKLPHFHFHWR